MDQSMSNLIRGNVLAAKNELLNQLPKRVLKVDDSTAKIEYYTILPDNTEKVIESQEVKLGTLYNNISTLAGDIAKANARLEDMKATIAVIVGS